MNTPFGATIHRVDDGIDTGKILWRKQVTLDPTDTGQTAYHKAEEAMTLLLQEHMEDIAMERIPDGIEQDEEEATYHHSSDFDDDVLDGDSFPLCDMIHDLRARTFDNNRSGRKIKIGDKTYHIHLKLVEAYD